MAVSTTTLKRDSRTTHTATASLAPLKGVMSSLLMTSLTTQSPLVSTLSLLHLSLTRNTVHAARLFREHGCRKVYVVATHGLMSEDCPELLQACDEIERVTVTNTIPQQKHMEKCAKLDVIDCSDVLAEAMRRLHFNESLYGMYAPAAPAVSTLRRASFRHSRSRGLSSSAAAPDE